jgi:hypothetical protein
MRAVSTSYSSSSLRNYLLVALVPADFALLQPHLRPVALALKQDIERLNRRIESVCFHGKRHRAAPVASTDRQAPQPPTAGATYRVRAHGT